MFHSSEQIPDDSDYFQEGRKRLAKDGPRNIYTHASQSRAALFLKPGAPPRLSSAPDVRVQ
eukprot:9497473-Pyramimonas_sp.AAC.2